MNTRVQALCATSLFATLLAVGAWITVPVGIPPYTMQSFMLYCALWLLPFRQSFAAVALYLLMGAVGLPVFAGFQGGFGALLGPTSVLSPLLKAIPLPGEMSASRTKGLPSPARKMSPQVTGGFLRFI